MFKEQKVQTIEHFYSTKLSFLNTTCTSMSLYTDTNISQCAILQGLHPYIENPKSYKKVSLVGTTKYYPSSHADCPIKMTKGETKTNQTTILLNLNRMHYFAETPHDYRNRNRVVNNEDTTKNDMSNNE